MIYIYRIIRSGIVLICFTILSIHFEKWWIILFAILFGESLKITSITKRTCDGCGKVICGEIDKIDNKYYELGWIRKKNGDKWEDYCPECKKEFNNEN